MRVSVTLGVETRAEPDGRIGRSGPKKGHPTLGKQVRVHAMTGGAGRNRVRPRPEGEALSLGQGRMLGGGTRSWGGPDPEGGVTGARLWRKRPTSKGLREEKRTGASRVGTRAREPHGNPVWPKGPEATARGKGHGAQIRVCSGRSASERLQDEPEGDSPAMRTAMRQ